MYFILIYFWNRYDGNVTRCHGFDPLYEIFLRFISILLFWMEINESREINMINKEDEEYYEI